MHIGLIIYGSLETLSGGYLYDRQLVGHLRACGDQVTVISLPWRNYGRHVLDNWRAWDSAESNPIPPARFDLLLQDELNHPSLAWVNPRLRHHLGCPIVAIVHHLRVSERHPRLLRPLYHHIESRYLATVDAFICNSQTTRHAVTALLQVERPLLVAPPGGDRFPHPPDNRPSPPPLRLLFVGNLIRRKGVHTLLEALIALPPGLVELTIVGNSQAAPRYSAQCRRYSAQHRLPVRWLGRLSDASLAAVYAASHVLVIPSEYEGFGIVFLEAMGMGLPVIAGAAGAATELITPGDNGYLNAPGDAAALANCLSDLARNPTLLAHLSEKARARFAAQPTWAQSMAAAREFLLAQLAPG